ncbi:V-set and transmembrane domain-containing protein 2-like protein [Antennarius striatus]|uniref:V-set and transmembrane domain-containing protein 2-like protein n=1 Tax=Antennarius striatus TaxID=241820 RepID=UPI0035AD8673
MGGFGVILRILQYAGLCFQLNAVLLNGEADNHIPGNALFTEVPHDITTQSGEDVEMACSFRGAASPTHSLEIQWWYIKDHREGQEKPAEMTNNILPLEKTSTDATKISVVKVAGSNISHKLRLSSVKPSDEGTYECCVIDFSGTMQQSFRVRAYLRVEPEGIHGSDEVQESSHQSQANHLRHNKQAEGRDQMRSPESTTDCNESCVL